MKYILLMIVPAIFLSCSKDEQKPDVGKPSVSINADAGEYKVKHGKSVTMTAVVENAVNPVYAWKLGGKIISTDLNCEFAGETVGEYFVIFRVDAENGFAEQQVKLTVMDKTPPEIDMPSSIIAYAGEDTEIKANVLYAENAVYLWRLEGTAVSETDTYIYNQTTLGAQTLSLKVSTDDGEDVKVFTVTTIPAGAKELFFDDGRYRVASNVGEMRRMTVPAGKSLVLAPVICNISNPAGFVWTVDGAAQSANGEYFTFTPSAQGVYLVAVVEQSTGAQAEVQVTCTEAEGAFFRPATESSHAFAAKAFDYVPAPGQFINFQPGSTKAAALQSVQTWLNNSRQNNTAGLFTGIGAFGGYWILGFDHSVQNVSGKADLLIKGNAFAGWSEPGVVWVMQDENGNGLPDDTWYELKGSETGKDDTKKRCAMTYYKPKSAGSNVMWTDNAGRTGSVDYNGFHSQAYYFPMFITEDYYTVVGTCLASNFFVNGGIEYARDLPWGYVDNYNTDAAHPRDEFWIEDAIHADGSPANLTYIDFVKVHTGATGKGAAVGEISTEVCVPVNMNF